MQYKEFFQWLEGYYGPYERDVLRRSVASYVKSIPEHLLDAIAEYLRLNFSTQYNFTPDVATIEVARKSIKPVHKPYIPRLPEPEAQDMSVEVGQLMEIVMMKVRRNREAREREEQC